MGSAQSENSFCPEVTIDCIPVQERAMSGYRFGTATKALRDLVSIRVEALQLFRRLQNSKSIVDGW
jgi:hypothetical protein